MDKYTEKIFRQLVLDLARLSGWKGYFTWNSIHSPAGFPDLVLVKGSDMLVKELKMDNRTPTGSQKEWLAALSRVTNVESGVWQPKDWQDITERLTRCESYGGD